MSSPTKPHYNPAAWRLDRLRIACHARGIDPNDARQLERLLNLHRAAKGRPPVGRKSVRRWLGIDGERVQDPSSGRTGHELALFELAAVLDVGLDWLMGRVSTEPTITVHKLRAAKLAEKARVSP
jgi:hypothetical protein